MKRASFKWRQLQHYARITRLRLINKTRLAILGVKIFIYYDENTCHEHRHSTPYF